jgi:hypothetical protein
LRKRFLGSAHQRVTFSFDHRNVIKQQLDPIEFAVELRLEVGWQSPAVACSRILEP